MQRISSFSVNHLELNPEIYLSRKDGDVFTYDVRFCKPYHENVLTNRALHSIEHLLATFLRNGNLKDSVIYVGPMGCQTGFYVLYRNVEHKQAREDILNTLVSILNYDGEMPGCSEIECGNCYTLSLSSAKRAIARFLSKIKQ